MIRLVRPEFVVSPRSTATPSRTGQAPNGGRLRSMLPRMRQKIKPVRINSHLWLQM